VIIFIIHVFEHVTILMSCNKESKENLTKLHTAKIPNGYHLFMKMLHITYEQIIFITGLLIRREVVLAFVYYNLLII
jgi:hypothetical protein